MKKECECLIACIENVLIVMLAYSEIMFKKVELKVTNMEVVPLLAILRMPNEFRNFSLKF